MLLDAEQKKELAQYILEQENYPEFVRDPYHACLLYTSDAADE